MQNLGDTPPSPARRPLTSSLGVSVFMIFTAAVAEALMITLVVFARHVMTTPTERLALVVGTIVFSVLAVAGVTVAVIDITRRPRRSLLAGLYSLGTGLVAAGLLAGVVWCIRRYHPGVAWRVGMVAAVLCAAVVAWVVIYLQSRRGEGRQAVDS